MKSRFQFGFLLGSLLPLTALCLLGHSERVSLVFGAGLLLVPALLWPRRVGGWLQGLGRVYERLTLRPARSGGRVHRSSGPEVLASECPGTANAKPTPESARWKQDVQSALQNFGCPKSRARAIAEKVAGIPDEKERLGAAMRMVRA